MNFKQSFERDNIFFFIERKNGTNIKVKKEEFFIPFVSVIFLKTKKKRMYKEEKRGKNRQFYCHWLSSKRIGFYVSKIKCLNFKRIATKESKANGKEMWLYRDVENYFVKWHSMSDVRLRKGYKMHYVHLIIIIQFSIYAHL